MSDIERNSRWIGRHSGYVVTRYFPAINISNDCDVLASAENELSFARNALVAGYVLFFDAKRSP